MRIGEGVEWAIHCCVLLAVVPAGRTLSAARLAEYHGVPWPYLAKHLQALAAAGIVESVAGRNGGYRMARPAAVVTVLDVVTAVEGSDPAFACTEIRQRGPAADPSDPSAYRAPCPVARAMGRAEEAWRETLRAVTVEDLLIGISRSATPVSIGKAAARTATWMKEVMR